LEPQGQQLKLEQQEQGRKVLQAAEMPLVVVVVVHWWWPPPLPPPSHLPFLSPWTFASV